jgi:hypothetical protein
MPIFIVIFEIFNGKVHKDYLKGQPSLAQFKGQPSFMEISISS